MSEYPDLRTENRRIIGWHPGINGTGHYCDHCEQTDDRIKFILLVGAALRDFLGYQNSFRESPSLSAWRWAE